MPSRDFSQLRVVVTGREGQVVRSLLERGQADGYAVIAVGRPELDLARPETALEALRNYSPDVVVNAAAYTAVDKAESEPEAALLVNGEGASAVAEAAARLAKPVIQISTDYVFDGSSPRAYRPADSTSPIGAYGRSKLAGERGVAAATADHAILRTAWVYSPFGANFVKTMLRLAATRDEVSVVDDQFGCPTEALAMAEGILSVARNLADQPGNVAFRGTFHMTGAGDVTWAGFAEAVFAESAARGGPHAAVKRITSDQFPTAAKRPKNSRLDCATLATSHGVALPAWQVSLRGCVARLLETGA